MSKQKYTCPNCHLSFLSVIVIYLDGGTKLILCPYCKAKFEDFSGVADPNHGVDPKGVV